MSLKRNTAILELKNYKGETITWIIGASPTETPESMKAHVARQLKNATLLRYRLAGKKKWVKVTGEIEHLQIYEADDGSGLWGLEDRRGAILYEPTFTKAYAEAMLKKMQQLQYVPSYYRLAQLLKADGLEVQP